MIKNILVLNSGSTSLKYKVFNEKNDEIAEGHFENITDHRKAIKEALREIGDLRYIWAIGHRYVHGGEKYTAPTLIDDHTLGELESLNDLAPLHNPYNLAGIKAIRDYFPEIPQVAVFDTAFYVDMPDVAKYYAIPEQMVEKYHVRKFGFHGISHKYIAIEAAKKLGKPLSGTNLITCHLGGGWSVTAIKSGKPIDTSMGFTPLEGLVMMTRCGDIDPGSIFYLINKLMNEPGVNNPVKDLYDTLHKHSGIKGMSGGIDDYRTLLKEVSFGNPRAKRTFDLAMYRLSKYIGSYWTALNGKVDALVFSGGIGSGDATTKEDIRRRTKCLGIKHVLTVKTNEELLIAKEARELVDKIKTNDTEIN